ncbi:MAG TPA: hypothetical protein VGD87_14010 [Archangium sp.]
MLATMTFRSLISLVVVLFSMGCAGSTAFIGTCPDGGTGPQCDDPSSLTPDLTLSPGGTGTKKLTLLVTGADVGTYDFSVAPQNDAKLTATVSPTSADLKDNVPQEIVVSITVGSDAPANATQSVYVTAKPKNGNERDGAGRAVFVKIP